MQKLISVSRIIFIAIVAIVFSFSSCKKYPEGSFFSLRSAKQRVMNNWKPTSYIIQGQEMVNLPQFVTQKQFYNSDGSYTQSYIDAGTGINQQLTGTWLLTESNKKLVVGINNPNSSQLVSSTTFSILKLYEKEMWIRSVNDSLEIHLVPVN
jgi:hypothetical protein